MSQPLVLSLFPGIGLLDMAFEEEGFCVVRGPDLLWGGDVKRFHPPAGKFDGVIGGPPCQAFSRLRHMVLRAGHELAPNLIPEFERCIREAGPNWFLMENVEQAPMPNVHPIYRVKRVLWNNRWNGAEQNRLRSFVFGCQGYLHAEFSIQGEALMNPVYEDAVLACGGQRSVPVKIGGSGLIKKRVRAGDIASRRTVEKAIRLQGLPEGFLEKAPFTVDGKQRVLGNGVPLPMGRAVARAVKQAMGYQLEATA
jgi:DNA (cytosine-5)-methyltransferase 1